MTDVNDIISQQALAKPETVQRCPDGHASEAVIFSPDINEKHV